MDAALVEGVDLGSGYGQQDGGVGEDDVLLSCAKNGQFRYHCQFSAGSRGLKFRQNPVLLSERATSTMKPKKSPKKLRITQADYLLAQRRAARMEEIAEHGKPVSLRSAVHRSKKVYDRKRLKKIDFE